jgi:hypothetical protein
MDLNRLSKFMKQWWSHNTRWYLDVKLGANVFWLKLVWIYDVDVT